MDSGNNFKISSKIGQIYTPEYIANLMVHRCIEYLQQNHNNSSKLRLDSYKVLDPCTGKGIFLKYLLKYGFSDIKAYELDSSLREKLSIKYPEVNVKFKNFLGTDLREKYDLIIGNPPYLGQNYNADLFQRYCKKFEVCEKYFSGNMDLFYFFIHHGIEKLNPGGILSFITTNYWITKSEKTGIKYLKPHILEDCLFKEYIDVSNLQIFSNATGQHNCIFILQKRNPKREAKDKDCAINVFQVEEKPNNHMSHQEYNRAVFQKIIDNTPSPHYKTYYSALANKDLRGDRSWNLLFPKRIKQFVEQIERYSIRKGKKRYLKDYFIIRNGLIFITDEIFVLKEGQHIKSEENNTYLRINGHFVKLLPREKKRLKKLYKSSAIKKYGFEKEEFEGYALYFNKNEYNADKEKAISSYFSRKYPHLTDYLIQHRSQLEKKLRNAKENPNHIYFPRRGDRMRIYIKNSQALVDLESLYEDGKKIFFPYISDTNLFGYTTSSYFATSDTYFLWPKEKDLGIDYRFLIAYLNSIIVKFLFKAKNIKIKRSKTKLENSIPIPNLDLFQSNHKGLIIELIIYLSSIMIKWNSDSKTRGENLSNLKIIEKLILKLPFLEIREFNYIVQNKDQELMQKTLDLLFCRLFEISPKHVRKLLAF